MNYEYASTSEVNDDVLVLTSASFYMYSKNSFGWHGPAAKSPERDLVEEGGVIFSVLASLSSDSLLRAALKTNIKQGKRTANIFWTFFDEEFGMFDQEKSEEKSALLIDENFYQQFSNNEVGVLDASNGNPALQRFWKAFKAEIPREALSSWSNFFH